MCDNGGYWGQVVCRMGQASWLADVGLPVIATILGLVVALLLLRQQLSHDVELRRAERREAVVWRFADECIDLASRMMDRQLPLDYWLAERWPEWHRLHYAAKQVEWHLGEGPAFEEIAEGGTDITHAWGACRDRREELVTQGEAIDARAHMEALWAVTQGLAGEVLVAGRELLSYDGTKPLPTFRPWRGKHLPDDESERATWRKQHADRYERAVRTEMARRSAKSG